MSCKILTSSFVTAAVLLSLGSAPAMAQQAPPPGYYAPQPYAPQPQPYPPQPYPPQAYPPQAYPPQAYPPQAYAAPPPAPGYHEHDGLYLRLLAGVGYLHNSASYGGVSETETGVGPTLAIAIGGVLVPNLVLYGEFSATMVSDPHFDNGTTSGNASGVTETLASIGPGIAYYLDGNMYLSGTLLFSNISYSDSNDSSNSVDGPNFGVGLGLTFGKEWWVSRDWGLGVSGQLSLSSMKDANVDTRWTGISASLLFSATCN